MTKASDAATTWVLVPGIIRCEKSDAHEEIAHVRITVNLQMNGGRARERVWLVLAEMATDIEQGNKNHQIRDLCRVNHDRDLRVYSEVL
jgi:hypothetical protein